MKPDERRSPEERELETKQAELVELQAELAQRELDLATLQAELRVFESHYLRVVGSLFAERDGLEAEIAEIVARQRPLDDTASRHAKHSRLRAKETANATRSALLEEGNTRFYPTNELKSLYREIAKLIHPDLASDPREHERRTRLMARTNGAFTRGDQKELTEILEEWQTSPELVAGDGIGVELVRAIRKIHQVGRRISQIAEEIAMLTGSDLYDLKERADLARESGYDLIAEMSQQLRVEITQLRAALGEAKRRKAV